MDTFLHGFPLKSFMCFLACACYMQFPCHRPRLGHHKEILCGVYITKPFNTKFTPAASFIFLLRYKYYSQRHVL